MKNAGRNIEVLDPGHQYLLPCLDGAAGGHMLTFVKRNKPQNKFPGNLNAYPGTTLQHSMRAQLERFRYLDSQKGHPCNTRCIDRLQECIWDLECRAAEQHGRKLTLTNVERLKIETLPCCAKCGHIKPELHEECK